MTRSPKSSEGFLISEDGTEIFYQIYKPARARGLPLILNDGLACDGYIWKYLISDLHNHHPIIHWNYRGHGNSSVPSNLESMSMDNIQNDLKSLLVHLKVKKCIFMGHSMGVQVVLEAYKHLHQQAAGLILLCGGPEYPLQTWQAPFSRNGFQLPLIDKVRDGMKLITKGIMNFPEFIHPLWKTAFQNKLVFHLMHKIELNPSRAREEDFKPYVDHLAKMDPRAFAKMFNSLIQHSATSVLNQIRKPTLIISGGKDTFSPAWVGEDMHATIEGSEFLNIPDGSHVTPIEHPELVGLRIEKFLKTHFDKPKRRRRAASSNGAAAAA